MNHQNKKKKNLGFTLVEVLIACSIITISMFALMQAASRGIILSEKALRRSQANLLLEEGAEAVKSIRNNDWTSISNLTPNVPYYLHFNTINPNAWALSNQVSDIDSTFTRTITVYSVNRDINDNIVNSGGAVDPLTKKVTINITWPEHGGLNEESLSFYIADIFN